MSEANISSKGVLRIEVEAIHYELGIPVRIRIENGVIAKITELRGAGHTNPSLYAAPGLIDNQVNGYAGVDFSLPSITSDGLKMAAREIWKDGVTTFLPTVVTGSHESIMQTLGRLSAMISDPDLHGCIPGIHLEGPYLSKEQGFYGCHPARYLREPSWDEFSEFQEAAGGKIIELTVAPELEGAPDLITKCSESGVMVAIGHTNANAQQIHSAAATGARLATHLGNGCANMIHRHLNPLWPQLADDRIVPTLIADGHHLLPEEMKVFFRVKGPENIILTSDVTCLIGMAPGFYDYMGSTIQKMEDGLILNPEQNCLAGASMPLKKGVVTMMKATGCTPYEAFNMASANPARVLGLTDRGTLDIGKRADIILFEVVENEIEIRETIVNGRIVYSNK